MRTFLVLILALASTNAFASKARVNSLLGANHLVDTQTVFNVPSHIMLLNPYMTFEFGAVGTGAEGGIMRNVGGGKLLAYVGHQNTTESEIYTDRRTAMGYIEQRNPIELIYGMGNMGFGASISDANDKTAGTSETSVALKFGMNLDNESWIYARAHVWDNAEKRTGSVSDEFNTLPYITLGGAKAMDAYRFFAEANFGTGEEDRGTAGLADRDVKDWDLSVGFEDRSLKKGDADIYYGIRATYADREIDGTSPGGGHVKGYKLPAFLGIEIPVVSWATFRGSLQQNILFGMTKDETAVANAKENSIVADTTVAAGLGFNYKNLVLDGSLTAAGDGNINGNTFMTQASVTYTF